MSARLGYNQSDLSQLRFVEPPWHEPLEAEAAIAAISPDASLAGMFFLAVAEGAKRRRVTLPGLRERYLPFSFYPVREFAPLLVAAAERFYPDQRLRQALRVIGKSGPGVFLESTLGKVTLGSAIGVQAAIEAIAKTYPVNIRSSQCTVTNVSARSCIVGLRDVHHFLDSHHVGVFEAVLEFARATGCVRIRSHSRVSADLLLEWT